MDLVAVRQLEHQARDACVALDPDAVALPEAVAMYESFARIEKLVSGARLRLARKVEEAGVAATAGARSAADLLAKVNGTSERDAREELDTSKRLASQPVTERAVANGDLSREQASAVSDAAGADPSAERKLLDDARSKSVRDLRDECDKVKANAHPDPAAKREAIRKDRHFRTWRDREGGWNAHIRLLPEDGAEVENHLAPHTQAAFDAARRRREHEPHDAYRADGLLAMARAASGNHGAPTPKGARSHDVKTFLHIDLDTLLQGRTQHGSICHIDRLGPVDLEWVRQVLGDSFVAALIKHPDGTIHDVIHLGRKANALQQTAAEARGLRCEHPDCDTTWGLELHHIEPWAPNLRTQIDLLAWLCSHHHDLVTHRGHTLTGPPGHRVWTNPDGTVAARDREGPAPPATAIPVELAQPHLVREPALA